MILSQMQKDVYLLSCSEDRIRTPKGMQTDGSDRHVSAKVSRILQDIEDDTSKAVGTGA